MLLATWHWIPFPWSMSESWPLRGGGAGARGRCLRFRLNPIVDGAENLIVRPSRVVLLVFAPGIAAYLLKRFRVSESPLNLRREVLGAAGLEQEAGFPGGDQLRKRTQVAGDDRQTGSKRLYDDERKTFIPGGSANQEPGAAHLFQNLGPRDLAEP